MIDDRKYEWQSTVVPGMARHDFTGSAVKKAWHGPGCIGSTNDVSSFGHCQKTSNLASLGCEVFCHYLRRVPVQLRARSD